MHLGWTLGRALPSACLLLLTLAASAPAWAGVARGTLLELSKLEQTPIRPLDTDFQAKMKRDLDSRAEDWKRQSTEVVFQQMFQENLAASVPSRKVRYTSVDSHGHNREYTGRVYLPSREEGAPPTLLPLVIYQHATETRRHFTPYFGKGDETLLGALAAEGCGFAVAMPDGDGMGGDPSPEVHAYCHGKTSAICLLDMIRAVLGSKDGDWIFDDEDYSWDGRIFIVGYSEGGYIAMSAVKELSTNPEYQDIHLTGAASMAGPFNFAESTRALLENPDTPYGRPYIPAYFLDAWADIYPNELTLDKAVNPALLGTQAKVPGEDSDNIRKWLHYEPDTKQENELSGDQITPKIQARLTGKKDGKVSARAIVNEEWYQKNLVDRTTELSKLLEENNLVGDWKPSVPVLLVSDPKDETVDFKNTQSMYDAWSRQNASPVGIVKLALLGKGTGHVGGAVVAIPTAFIWIDAGMPRGIMDMGVNAITSAIEKNTPEAILEGVEAAQEMGKGHEDFAALPLSRVEFSPSHGKEDYEVTFNDWLIPIGKVKFFTLTQAQQYPGQPLARGVNGYTKFIGQIKSKGDRLSLPTGEPVYMAVYPQKTAVALTLKFAGGPPGKGDFYTINIKQGLKSKLLNRRSPAAFDLSSNVVAKINKKAFEKVKKGPFLTLP
jgi:hypothetical protein